MTYENSLFDNNLAESEIFFFECFNLNFKFITIIGRLLSWCYFVLDALRVMLVEDLVEKDEELLLELVVLSEPAEDGCDNVMQSPDLPRHSVFYIVHKIQVLFG